MHRHLLWSNNDTDMIIIYSATLSSMQVIRDSSRTVLESRTNGRRDEINLTTRRWVRDSTFFIGDDPEELRRPVPPVARYHVLAGRQEDTVS